MINLNVKIYNHTAAIDCAADWGVSAESGTLEQVLSEPFRIACVPMFLNDPNNFAYDPEFDPAVLSQFDLVLLSDIELAAPSDVYAWTAQYYLPKYLMAFGSLVHSQPLNPETSVYRPWWMYNLMRFNQPRELSRAARPFLFDALLGTRRPHRDYVMLAMTKHQCLLDKSIVTYRDVFTGGRIDQLSDEVRQQFPDIDRLPWPYISSNLDPAWEVSDQIKKSISPFVPHAIYDQTYYSIICETVCTSDGFFLTEKTSKAFYDQRPFVTFGAQYFLENLRQLGFETFGSVVDEDYDYEYRDVKRFKQAFDSVLSLSQQNPTHVYNKLEPVLAHNRHHMTVLQKRTKNQMSEMLQNSIPNSAIKSIDVE